MEHYLVILLVLTLYLRAASFQDFSSESKLIDTSRCQIPNIPPYDANFTTFTQYDAINCTGFKQLLSYTTTDEYGTPWLRIREDVATEYFGSPENITCCYSYFFRNGNAARPDVGVVYVLIF